VCLVGRCDSGPRTHLRSCDVWALAPLFIACVLLCVGAAAAMEAMGLIEGD
jgi:hypothetical protein